MKDRLVGRDVLQISLAFIWKLNQQIVAEISIKVSNKINALTCYSVPQK